MSSEWKEISLDDIAELNGGYAFKSEEYTDKGHFVLRTVNITDDGRICRDGAAYVSPAAAKKYERFLLKDLDTLFVMVGATLGKTGLVKSGDLPALLNQNMWVVRARTDQVDPLFLHYEAPRVSRRPVGLSQTVAA
ncbi:restriction endonuclease subunit S [Aquabacterium sp.]|uniref:restriction endonuclease subunit S n=1 Tax=Aquabacterium sp. TaxID=1872578 RepID=UPI00261AAB1B|nr:restriction endonuclease subunit S [Aquabacterium sp.]MDD2978051.1 restriction endonuclease subunit S [Aquabacterium sp.]